MKRKLGHHHCCRLLPANCWLGDCSPPPLLVVTRLHWNPNCVTTTATTTTKSNWVLWWWWWWWWWRGELNHSNSSQPKTIQSQIPPPWPISQWDKMKGKRKRFCSERATLLSLCCVTRFTLSCWELFKCQRCGWYLSATLANEAEKNCLQAYKRSPKKETKTKKFEWKRQWR